MYLLRRGAARAISASRSSGLLVRPRSVNTLAPIAFRSTVPRWTAPAFQRRCASDEAVKSDEVRTEEVKADEVETEEVKTEEVKTDEIKTDEVKTEEVETDEIKTDEVETDEIKTDEVETDEIKTDEVKTDEIKPEEVETDEMKTDEFKTDEIKTDEVETDEMKPEEVETDEIKTDEVKTDEIKTDEVKTDEIKTEDVKTDEIKTDEVKTEQVKTSEDETFAQTAAEAPVVEKLTPAANTSPAASTDPFAAEAYNASRTANDHRLSSRDSNSRFGTFEPNNILYIGNLFYDVKEHQVRRLFARFGEITDVSIVTDPRGRSRGFGYVEFKDIDDARAAIESLHSQVFEGRNLVVMYHKAKRVTEARSNHEPHPITNSIFIGNMPYEMSDKDLNDLFRDIRNVTDVRVAIDRRTGQPRGFAHADFIDVASAVRAKESLNEKVIYGRKIRVDFSTPSSRKDKNNGSLR